MTHFSLPRGARLTRMMRAPAVAVLALAAIAPVASADTTLPVFSCRASAAYVESPQLLMDARVEPILANGFPSRTGTDPGPDRPQCVDDSAGAPNVVVPPGDNPGIQLTLQAPYARTTIEPEFRPAREQTATAEAGTTVNPLMLDLGPQQLTIVANATASSATATCVGAEGARTPLLTGSSTVDALSINGTAVPVPPGSEFAEVDVSPLIKVLFNQTIPFTAPNGDRELVQRAVEIQALIAPGEPPVATVVLAESKVDTHGAVCAAPPPCPAGSTLDTMSGVCVAVIDRPVPGPTVFVNSNTGPTAFERRLCPTGSTFDRERELCIITQGPGRADDIVVGAPGDVPVGGLVASTVLIKKLFGDSTCLRGAGPAFAIVGTKGNDRITGTNRRDRIITFGGNDRVDGGRNDDCIEGRGGRDTLSGGQDKDIVIGGSGNDALNGGSGTDRLDGGTGNDTINAAFGQDRITGGPGIDFINVATAGKPATVNCGSGRDKVRGNFNERRKVRGCEVQFFLR